VSALLPAPLIDEDPARLLGARSRTGAFTVSWLCACDPADTSYYSIILNLSRGPVSDIARTLRFARLQQHAVRRVRVAGRERWRFTTDAGFGYVWAQQHLAYTLSEHDSNQVGWPFLNEALRGLVPLGHEWVGRTRQGAGPAGQDLPLA